MAREELLLEIEGPYGPKRVERAKDFAFWALLILGAGTLALVAKGWIPWLPELPLRGRARRIATGAIFVAAVAAGWGVQRLLRSRSGRVLFFEDHVVIRKFPRGSIDVAWSGLARYRDDSADYIQLLRKGETRGSSDLTVPTPNEEDRVAVLALLDRKGLVRDDS